MIVSEIIIVDVLRVELKHLIEQLVCYVMFFAFKNVYYYVIEDLICLSDEIVFITDLLPQLFFNSG